jgi:Mg-chelatase subunit ChlD
MAKKNKPLSVYVALDRSGSMAGERWTHAIDSINEYVNGLKKEKIEGTVSIVAFDYGQSMRLVDLVTDQSIAYFEPLTKECAQPSGMTPLFDAAANVMNRAMENNAERTVVVIMTDGEENSSKEYNQASIKAKVTDLTLRKWEVLFLGANFDVSQYTAGSGLSATKMRNVDFSNVYARTAMQADLTSSTVAYATAGQAINLAVDVKVKV